MYLCVYPLANPQASFLFSKWYICSQICPLFFLFFSFASLPAHESHNQLYFFIFIFHSVSVSLPLFPFLPMQSELAAYDADGILISSNLHPNNHGVESWFTSSFLLSPTLLEPLILLSYTLFQSPLPRQQPTSLYCAFIVGVFENV